MEAQSNSLARRRRSDRFPSPWLGIALSLVLQLAAVFIAYGRLSQRVEDIHEDLQVVKHLLLERGVNR